MADARPGMGRSFSLYLDLLRLGAALTVLLAHAAQSATLGKPLFANSVGHNAVVVFFLLSGYVIAYVSDGKERTAREFWISRLARIYSVALPAMLLAPLADQIGLAIDPRHYDGGLTTHDYPLVRLAASLVFANELWLVSIMPFSNSPYWSLCYEMAYYLLFSLWCFGGRRRWLWMALAALAIGPKILLLAPVWALGVALYRWQGAYRLSAAAGWLYWLGSLAGLALFQYADLGAQLSRWTGGLLGPELYKQLHFSKHFLGDYPLALLIGLNFIGFRRIAGHFDGPLGAVAPAIRKAASYTFSIYLFHAPLVLLFEILLAGMGQGFAYLGAVLASTLATVVLLGTVTEQQKDRLRHWLARRWDAGVMTGKTQVSRASD